MKTEDFFSKVLITGAGGMVGSYVDFGIKTDRQFLDITNFEAVQGVISDYKPTAIIHLAAETDMSVCEKSPERAYLVNSTGTYNLAILARDLGSKMVYISTNAVFDGLNRGPYKEDDLPFPNSVYGKSKYIGELIVGKLSNNYLIIRTSWIFGGGPQKDKKFVKKIIEQLNGSEIKAVDDQIGSPTFGKDLIAAIKKLLLEDAGGIFHLANSGVCSRYEFTREIINILKPDVKIVPVKSGFFNLDAKRTTNEGLVSKVNLMRPWQEALREYLETEWKPFLKL